MCKWLPKRLNEATSGYKKHFTGAHLKGTVEQKGFLLFLKPSPLTQVVFPKVTAGQEEISENGVKDLKLEWVLVLLLMKELEKKLELRMELG